MSFRKEEKLKVDKNKLVDLLDWININKGYKLFESRIVSSTYFDNSDIRMFRDSEDGCVPRKKIRVRDYGIELDMAAIDLPYDTNFWSNLSLPPDTKFYKKIKSDLEGLYGVKLETQFNIVNKKR